MQVPDWLFFRLLSLYPPYLGAGVRVAPAPGGGVRVRMGLHFWNRNYLGTHFGGSLYTMCDPFFVLLLSRALGPGWVVWDKAAEIRFRRPGRGRVEAMIAIPPQRLEEIRNRGEVGETVEPVFTIEVRDRQGQVVAEVEKLLYVRRKARSPW